MAERSTMRQGVGRAANLENGSAGITNRDPAIGKSIATIGIRNSKPATTVSSARA